MADALLGVLFGLLFRPSPAVEVKIATQKVSISTLTTDYLKNTPTIISIPLFIFLKYYFLIFFFISFRFSLSLSGHSSLPVGSVEFHNNNKHKFLQG
jgi:hypothetical protein